MIAPQHRFEIDTQSLADEQQQTSRDAGAALEYLRTSLPTLNPLSDDDVAAAVAQLDGWALASKTLEARLKDALALVKPIEKHFRSIYKPAIGFCDQAATMLKAWLAHSRAVRQAQVQQQLAIAAATSNPAELQAAMAVSVQAAPGTRIVEVWSARVIDATALPVEYWCINEARLDAEAKAVKGQQAPPPGVEWVKTERIDRTGR